MADASYFNLPSVASHLREELQSKRSVLIYACNGTGKTRLSGALKDLGKRGDKADTLYFNAFTEDLFSWDNDLKNDRERVLKINRDSRFFAGLGELEMDTRIRPLLDRYADFDFRIDTDEWEVTFRRDVRQDDGGVATVDDIKISRGEENIFIWCFFLAIVRLALDGAEAYKWVKFVYVDDPISSLDENNAVMVAHHLASTLAAAPDRVRVVVSSHHVLFFNVLCNEMKRRKTKYLLTRETLGRGYTVQETDGTPFLYHLSSLVELHKAETSKRLFTYHFNMMRRVMEQTACFFGYESWENCIKPDADDPNGSIYKRMIDLMSHGDYSLYEPREMMPENKGLLGRALRQFIANHPFSPALFPSE